MKNSILLLALFVTGSLSTQAGKTYGCTNVYSENSPDNTRYCNKPINPNEAEFAKNLKIIMAAAPDKFNAIKGQHKIEIGHFWSREWYELNLTLYGMRELSIPLEISINPEVEGIFFSSIDSTQAYAEYEKLLAKTQAALGSSYCHMVKAGPVTQTIFALENEKLNDRTSVATVRFWKVSGAYRVELHVGYKRYGGIV